MGRHPNQLSHLARASLVLLFINYCITSMNNCKSTSVQPLNNRVLIISLLYVFSFNQSILGNSKITVHVVDFLLNVTKCSLENKQLFTNGIFMHYIKCRFALKDPENALVQEPDVERKNKWQEIKFKFISFETIEEILLKYFLVNI